MHQSLSQVFYVFLRIATLKILLLSSLLSFFFIFSPLSLAVFFFAVKRKNLLLLNIFLCLFFISTTFVCCYDLYQMPNSKADLCSLLNELSAVVGLVLHETKSVLDPKEVSLAAAMVRLRAAHAVNQWILQRATFSEECEFSYLHREGRMDENDKHASLRWWWHPEQHDVDPTTAYFTSTERILAALSHKSSALECLSCLEPLLPSSLLARMREIDADPPARLGMSSAFLGTVWWHGALTSLYTSVAVTRSSEASRPTEVTSAAFRCCLDALDAARIACVQFAYAACTSGEGGDADDVSGTLSALREALHNCDLSAFGEPAGEATCVDVHPSVELSSNPLRVCHGVGVLAVGEVGEGECIAAEVPLAGWRRGGCPGVLNRAAEEALKVAPHQPGVSSTTRRKWASLSSLDGMTADALASRVADGSYAVSISELDALKVGKQVFAEVCGQNRWGSLRYDELGKALCHFSRHLNHSCTPNALLIFEQSAGKGVATPEGVLADTVYVVALRNIAAGEEITISYLPIPLVSANEKSNALGFHCLCAFCQQKQPLLEGVKCGECGRLVSQSGDPGLLFADEGSALPFQHSDECTWVREQFSLSMNDAVCKMERRLSAVLSRLLTLDTAGEDELTSQLLTTLQELLELDKCSNTIVLSTHSVRVQLRLQALAVFALSAETPLRLCGLIMQMTADFLEDIELLLTANFPLLTDVRMLYVLCRSRYASASAAKERLASGVRTDDCCGAVRHEASVLSLPYVMDSVVRDCVVRSFQEHYVQSSVLWNNNQNNNMSKTESEEDEGVLAVSSFISRFPHELAAAGIESSQDMDMLALL